MSTPLSDEQRLQAVLATKELRAMCEEKAAPNLMRAAELIEAGADINDTDSLDYSLLHELVKTNHLELAKLLIAKGADVDHPRVHTNMHSTPLLYATWGHPNAAMAKLLIDHGASIAETDSIGDTPLHNTSLKGELEVAEYIIHTRTEIDPSLRNKSKSNVLERTVSQGKKDFLEMLLRKGWPIDAVSLTTARNAKPSSSIYHCYKVLTDTVDQAYDLLEQFIETHHADTSTLTPYGVCRLANANLHHHVFRPNLWQGKDEALVRLLSDLPPWLAHDIIADNPGLPISQSLPRGLINTAHTQHNGAISPTDRHIGKE